MSSRENENVRKDLTDIALDLAAVRNYYSNLLDQLESCTSRGFAAVNRIEGPEPPAPAFDPVAKHPEPEAPWLPDNGGVLAEIEGSRRGIGDLNVEFERRLLRLNRLLNRLDRIVPDSNELAAAADRPRR